MEQNNKSIGFVIDRTLRKIRQHLQKKFNENNYDITVEQWVVLDMLQQKNGIPQNEIAENTFKDAPTVTRIIDQLCKKGWVYRQTDNDDRRKFNVFVTIEGLKVAEQLLPFVFEVRQKSWEGLSEEDYQHLIRILNVIYGNLEELPFSKQLPPFALSNY